MEELDLRGLKCPLPAMLAKKALEKAAPGTRLAVLADDPLSVVDIPHMCASEGHRLEATAREAGWHQFILVRAP